MFAIGRGPGARGFTAYRSMCIWAVLAVVIAYILTGGKDVYKFRKWHRRTFFSGPSGGQAQSGGPGTFNYKYAVAYQAKDRSDSIYAGLSVESPTGEDNYFLSQRSAQDLFAGVADGVGGWAEHGFDSSAISRELCGAMHDFALQTKGVKSFTPKQLIDLAYSKILQEGNVKVGGTTAIVAHFPPNGKLSVANLGDSWCGVFRNSKLACFPDKVSDGRFQRSLPTVHYSRQNAQRCC